MAQQQEQLAAIDVKKTFWEDLKSDLEVVAQEWTLLPEKQAATALTAVITVA
jgi:chromosome segregation and condensation protein ScpB